MQSMPAQSLKEMIDQKEHFLLIDVRTPEEHQEVSIEGALFMPLQELGSYNVPEGYHRVICFCRSGGRSKKAKEMLLEKYPHLQITDLEGGILAWTKEGYPLKRGGGPFIAIGRQIHIVAGALILFGVSFGFLVNPLYFGIAAFVGGGLLFSGLSGWCGLGLLLQKMPWNKRA